MFASLQSSSPVHGRRLALACALGVLAGASCQALPPEPPPASLTWPVHPDFHAHGESVKGFRELLGEQRQQALPGLLLERITTAVPWPRGLVAHDGQLVVLARGRHRNAGGLDAAIDDSCGLLFVVDPALAEPVRAGEMAGPAVAANARVLALPSAPPFQLYQPQLGPPLEADAVDRPYCTLVYDAASQNYFVCGYSGVDLPGRRFRKNATDSILRYDLRDQRWHQVELHDASVVPRDLERYVVPSNYYPHHDPSLFEPPHGLLNGPNGALVVGDSLYAVGKDNHSLARYELAEIRESPDAPAPAGEVVLREWVQLERPAHAGGGVTSLRAMGASALEARDGWLYVGYRTSSVVLRFPLDERGHLRQPAIGQLIASFEPWRASRGRSANLIDLAFDSRGELYVSCAEQGRVWNIGRPDPEQPFDGDDQADPPTANRPWVDLQALTGNPRARSGNIAFDERDQLYLCSGNYDSGTRLAGVIYRATRAR